VLLCAQHRRVSQRNGCSKGDQDPEPRPRLGASTAMSCRIERTIEGEKIVVLSVSGLIHGEDVETLREVIGREKDRLALDLTEVILVDREAVRLLAVSEATGIELRNCPAYIREWILKERVLGYGP
jgi:hypothetical protein